jgi:hypothetical protein
MLKHMRHWQAQTNGVGLLIFGGLLAGGQVTMNMLGLCLFCTSLELILKQGGFWCCQRPRGFIG